jgi:hypothetical protein
VGPTRIIDSNYYYDDKDKEEEEEEGIVQEMEKARHIESVLCTAMTLAERNTGSMLCFQNVTSQSCAEELGRSLSCVRSIENTSNRIDTINHDVHEDDSSLGGSRSTSSSRISRSTSSSCSFNSVQSFPTFLRVEQGDPIELAQKSWESLFLLENEGRNVDSGSNADNNNIRGGPSSSSVVVMDDKTKVVLATETPRSWNKLRKSMKQEMPSQKDDDYYHDNADDDNDIVVVGTERNESNYRNEHLPRPKMENRPKKGFPKTKGNNDEKVGRSTVQQQSMMVAKDVCVEISLTEQKTLWRRLGRGRTRTGVNNTTTTMMPTSTSTIASPQGDVEKDMPTYTMDPIHDDVNADMDKTQDVTLDVSSSNDDDDNNNKDGSNDKGMELKTVNTITRRKVGWGWRKNEAERTDNRPRIIENRDVVSTLQSKGKEELERDLAEEPTSESPRVVPIDDCDDDDDIVDRPQDSTESTTATTVNPVELPILAQIVKGSTFLDALSEWTRFLTPSEPSHPLCSTSENPPIVECEGHVTEETKSIISDTNPATMLSVEEAQSMECVWLSNFE